MAKLGWTAKAGGCSCWQVRQLRIASHEESIRERVGISPAASIPLIRCAARTWQVDRFVAEPLGFARGARTGNPAPIAVVELEGRLTGTAAA